jgi:hypothetical protein
MGPAYGINCFWNGSVGAPTPPPSPGSVCSFDYDGTQPVTITAAPASGSTFGGWGTSCVGAGLSQTANSCTITPGLVSSVQLTPIWNGQQTLTITKTGNGSGTVTSSPSGINCGTACAATFVPPQSVTLTATPSAGSVFSGWGGACLGAGTNPTCSLTLAQTTNVTATFTARPTFTFTISTAGQGTGTVTSSPAGLNCPPTCTAAVVGGTTLTLTPNPAAGSEFGGWTGSCTGLGPCTVTVNAAGAVTATFNRAAVDAAVQGTSFTKNGPRGAKRVLHVTVAADEQVRVSLRIVRDGVVLASKVVPRFRAGERNVNVRVRNGIGSGRAQLQITFTDQFGNTKNQSRRVRIPAL